MPPRNEKITENSGDWPRPNPWRARVAAARTALASEKPDEEKNNNDDDLAALIESANEDVSDTRKELFAFVAALVFIVVTNYSITARDLLALAPVRLPFIGLAVPLRDFFFWTPLAIVAIHVAVMLRLARLREKLKATRKAIVDSPESGRAGHFQKVVSNFLMQVFVVRHEAQGRRLLLWWVYVLVAFIGPFFTLLAIVVRALPLHIVELTFSQNLALGADVGVAAYLFQERRKTFGFLSFVFAIDLANLVLCVPDSGFDRLGVRLLSRPIVSPTSDPLRTPQRMAFWPTAFLFESEVDPVTRRPWFLGLSRNIVLVDDKPSAGGESASGPGGTAPKAATAAGAAIALRGRDLRYAIFDRSDLSGADFVAADLYRASLLSVDLSRAQFGCLYPEHGYRSPQDKRCTNLTSARLEGADLRGAKFQWLDKQRQSLAGVDLTGARLEGATLVSVDLSRASLRGTKLMGAHLLSAQFVGALLDEADMTGAIAWSADFSFSSMRGAHLDGADLRSARFLATDMSGTSLFKTRLSSAQLGGAVLRHAKVWETETPDRKAMAWTDLDGLVVKPFDNSLVQRLQRAIDDNSNLTAAAVYTDVPVAPWDAGLKQLRDAATKSSARRFEYLPAWEEGKKLLVAKNDAGYVESYKTALAEFACFSASYVEAIMGDGPVWDYFGDFSYGGSDVGYLGSSIPINMIQDSRLAQLKNWPSAFRQDNSFAYDGYFSDGFGADSSPSELFDLSRLVTALDGGPKNCPAAENVSEDTKKRLREAAKRQRDEHAASLAPCLTLYEGGRGGALREAAKTQKICPWPKPPRLDATGAAGGPEAGDWREPRQPYRWPAAKNFSRSKRTN